MLNVTLFKFSKRSHLSRRFLQRQLFTVSLFLLFIYFEVIHSPHLMFFAFLLPRRFHWKIPTHPEQLQIGCISQCQTFVLRLSFISWHKLDAIREKDREREREWNGNNLICHFPVDGAFSYIFRCYCCCPLYRQGKLFHIHDVNGEKRRGKKFVGWKLLTHLSLSARYQ